MAYVLIMFNSLSYIYIYYIHSLNLIYRVVLEIFLCTLTFVFHENLRDVCFLPAAVSIFTKVSFGEVRDFPPSKIYVAFSSSVDQAKRQTGP